MKNTIKKSIEIICDTYNLEHLSINYNESKNKNDPSLFIYNSLNLLKCKDDYFYNEKLICNFILKTLPKLANKLCKLENFGGFLPLPSSLVYGMDELNHLIVRTLTSQTINFNNNSFFKECFENLYFREIIIEKNDLTNHNKFFFEDYIFFPYLIEICQNEKQHISFNYEKQHISFNFRVGLIKKDKDFNLLSYN